MQISSIIVQMRITGVHSATRKRPLVPFDAVFSRVHTMSASRSLLRLSLTGNNRRLVHQWCNERCTWTTEWNDIVFNGEFRFCL
ncbi:hypothetical protein TNCV_804721 [Trichonephila clavipes]|nr:hypothetical protein TNCV_804721 [Trichonephila clavipes]